MNHIFNKVVFLCAVVGLAVSADAAIRAKAEQLGGREIYVYAPAGLEEGKPLMISCHGMGQDPAYQAGMANWEDKADKEGFVVVYPHGNGNAWDLGGAGDEGLIKNIIDEMYKRYKIDLSRVYLSGFSMGGMFTHFTATHLADKIAAFAPVSGYPIDAQSFSFKASRNIPIMHTNGDADDVVHYEEWTGTFNGMYQHQMGAYYVMEHWAAFNQCDSKPVESKVGTATRYTWKNCAGDVEVVLNKIPGKGHWHSNDAGYNTTDNIWEFVSKYSLNGVSKPIEVPADRDTIFNSEFGDSLKLVGWSLNTWSGEAKLQLTGGEAEVAITKAADDHAYQIQMIQKGLHFEKGTSYKLVFDAHAAAAREIEVNVEMDDEPWTSYLPSTKKIEIGTEKKTYEVSFTMGETTDKNGRVSFNVGLSDVNVFFDNIKLMKIDASEVEEEKEDEKDGEKEENPTFVTAKFKNGAMQNYKVYSVSGVLVGSFNASSFAEIKLQLNAMNLDKGVYLVRNKFGFSKVQQVR